VIRDLVWDLFITAQWADFASTGTWGFCSVSHTCFYDVGKIKFRECDKCA